jgi:hypothetical protein
MVISLGGHQSTSFSPKQQRRPCNCATNLCGSGISAQQLQLPLPPAWMQTEESCVMTYASLGRICRALHACHSFLLALTSPPI